MTGISLFSMLAMLVSGKSRMDPDSANIIVLHLIDIAKCVFRLFLWRSCAEHNPYGTLPYVCFCASWLCLPWLLIGLPCPLFQKVLIEEIVEIYWITCWLTGWWIIESWTSSWAFSFTFRHSGTVSVCIHTCKILLDAAMDCK